MEKCLSLGNCFKHYEKAKQGTWGNRAIQLFIIFLQLLPIISQIAVLEKNWTFLSQNSYS
jgi:hypothetical protein